MMIGERVESIELVHGQFAPNLSLTQIDNIHSIYSFHQQTEERCFPMSSTTTTLIREQHIAQMTFLFNFIVLFLNRDRIENDFSLDCVRLEQFQFAFDCTLKERRLWQTVDNG